MSELSFLNTHAMDWHVKNKPWILPIDNLAEGFDNCDGKPLNDLQKEYFSSHADMIGITEYAILGESNFLDMYLEEQVKSEGGVEAAYEDFRLYFYIPLSDFAVVRKMTERMVHEQTTPNQEISE